MRALRRKFGPKEEEVAGGWRTLHNEELHDLYPSPNIIRGIKSRGLGLVGLVVRMRGEKFVQYVGWKSCREEIWKT
jgi:hypothetical protein